VVSDDEADETHVDIEQNIGTLNISTLINIRIKIS